MTTTTHGGDPTVGDGVAPDPAGSRRRGVRFKQVLVAAATVVVMLVMLGLGIWQMSVYLHQGRQHLIERSHQAPVPITTSLEGNTPLGDLYGLQVTMSGHYLPHSSALIGAQPPYRVVDAFAVGSRVVPVVRGTVGSLTASIPDTPQGTLAQTGILMPSESSDGSTPPSGAPSSMLTSMNVERLAQSWPEGVIAGFVTLNSDQATAQHLAPATVTFPDDASGKAQNLGYAIQWWVFAVFAGAMGIVFIRSLGRRSAPVAPDESSTGPTSLAG